MPPKTEAPAKSAATKVAPKAAPKAAVSKASAPKASTSKTGTSSTPAKAKATSSSSSAVGTTSKPKPAAVPEKDEEEEYLLEYSEQLPPDPWKEYKSAYGGPLSAAECYDRLRKGLAGDEKLGLKEVFVISKHDVQTALSALDPKPKSVPMAVARALDAVLAGKGGAAQRVAVSGCGLSGFQFTAGVVSRFVELDLSFNELASVDRLGGNSLRCLILAGNKLTKVPFFAVEMPKLVKLDLSFNNVDKLPGPSVLSKLPNLRCFGLQNCMIKSIAAEGGGGCAFTPMQNLVSLDLSFNLLSSVPEMLSLTSLQRLQELDVGCNELCAVEGYDEAIKALRMKMSNLKKLNDEEVRRQFGGYGMEAMEHMMISVADALSNDKSSCSCIEGNPCLSPECCDNWKDRFKIAHKVRLEKYWDKGRNFDG